MWKRYDTKEEEKKKHYYKAEQFHRFPFCQKSEQLLYEKKKKICSTTKIVRNAHETHHLCRVGDNDVAQNKVQKNSTWVYLASCASRYSYKLAS